MIFGRLPVRLLVFVSNALLFFRKLVWPVKALIACFQISKGLPTYNT